MVRMTTKQAARGKWNGIISQLLGQQAVSKRHTSCPICGGADRYRYDNKRGDGDWFCNVCGVGDGFKLITGALGIGFAEAAKRIDSIVGNIEPETPFENKINIEKRRNLLNKVWAEAKNPSVVAQYLAGRGIRTDVIANARDLRGTDRLYHHEDGAYYPGMLALIRDKNGEPVSIHRTYFMNKQKEKKIMPPISTIKGCCIRLGDPDSTLIIAEGIETALAATMMLRFPAWATISAHGMESLQSIPKHVTRVIVCADNDESFTGQAAAFACAKYMKLRLGIPNTEVVMSPVSGYDILDHAVKSASELRTWK